jgi:hypothetical protein
MRTQLLTVFNSNLRVSSIFLEVIILILEENIILNLV